MKWSKNLISLAVAVIFGLSLILVPVVSQVSPVQAAITWTKSTTSVTLDNERYVGDAWVIKDDTTYKMWYTHGTTDLTVTQIVSSMTTSLGLSPLISDIASLALVSFLGHLGSVDITEARNLLDGTSTVIGYATSSNRVTWTVQDSEVLAGSGAAWNSVGAPCVIKVSDTDYRMWYTRVKTDLTLADLQTILTNLGVAGQRKDALLDLINSTRTVIGYATSDDGVTWAVQNSEVLAGGGPAWNSVADPCVIKDGTTYKMWYTQGKTDITQADLDAMDAATFGLDEILAILDGTSTVIGYTTSSNGIDWEATQEVLAGNGDAWSSVAKPSVVKSSSYEMWYTQGITNLTQANLSILLSEIADLAESFWAILEAFGAGDFEQLLDDLDALDISTIKDLLGNTRTVIGYATSTIGTDWTVQSSQHLVGTSTSAWSSVAAPSVVKDGATYYMWYTEGIDDLTLTNLLALVLGTDLPIGYATYTPVVPPTPGVGVGISLIYYIKTNLFGIEKNYRISSEGGILKIIEATSEDSMLTITIPEGTIALDKDSKRLERLQAAVDESPPSLPENAYIIGLAYDLTPAGATFDPPITFKYTYDPADIPEGVAEEDLVLAYYDEDAGEWVELPCTVDPLTHTITASVSHLTTFAIIGTITPATFTLSMLNISPVEVNIDETVTISLLVTNTGGKSGSHTVTLTINDVVVATEYVTLAAGASQKVTLTTVKDVVGTYAVNVDGLSGTFTVKPELKPATFDTSSLSISPTEVDIGGTVTISVLVANTGDLSGSYRVTLMINNVVVATKYVTLAGGASQEVTFTTVKDVVGTYAVNVDGLSGTFVVEVAPPALINWWLIGGIITALVIAGLLIYFMVIRRRVIEGEG